MRYLLRARPSPAMVVALVALFVALSGTAVALSGSNTVFSDDITNNQVYSADVRDDTLSQGGLQAVDLAPGSVGGSEIRNGSLTAADLGSGLPKVESLGMVFLPPGQNRVLLQHGPFTLTGTCTSGPRAELSMTTSEDHSSVVGLFGVMTDWLSSSPPLIVVGAGSQSEPESFNRSHVFNAAAPDGSTLTGISLFAGTKVLGRPNQCVFGGHAATG